jgi:hypothetical protein
MADQVGQTVSRFQYENLQRARKELRHQAHIYANTKGGKFEKDRAAENLENAALAVSLAAAIWGIRAGCARPAGKIGADWEESVDPENALARDRAAEKAAKKRKVRR